MAQLELFAGAHVPLARCIAALEAGELSDAHEALAGAGPGTGAATDRRRLAALAARIRSFSGPHLGARTDAAFEQFFSGQGLTHSALVAFAADGPEGAPLPRCRVCDLSTRDFAPAPAALPGPVLAAIRRDLPSWRPADGLCGRCADLYGSHGATCS